MNSEITWLEQTISTLEARRATLCDFVIAGGAEGNSFYMEELAKILIEGPVIDASWGSWQVSLGLAAIQLGSPLIGTKPFPRW